MCTNLVALFIVSQQNLHRESGAYFLLEIDTTDDEN